MLKPVTKPRVGSSASDSLSAMPAAAHAAGSWVTLHAAPHLPNRSVSMEQIFGGGILWTLLIGFLAIASVIGAIVLLLIYGMVRKKK